MKRTVILITTIFLILSISAHGEEITAEVLVYDEFIENEHIKEDILKVVKDYIEGKAGNRGYLTVKGKAKKERQFAVVEVFDVVSRKDNIYTVQVDADEISGEPRYLLFCDLEKIDGEFKLIGIRIGPRHLRQTFVTMGE